MTKSEIVDLAIKHGWTIEFSSSFPHDNDMVRFFTEARVNRMAHNYFPAPKDPFVLNLASSDKDIRARSIAHCMQGLELSKKCGSPYFSAHAGFCIDPDPVQLGNQLNVNQDIDRDNNWKLFLDSLRTILGIAEQMEVGFLVENNVTTKFNLRRDGQEVLFCSGPEEMVQLVKEIDSNWFGLLLDTAHLKVSAAALEFDWDQAADKVQPYVRYVHHSDNNGEKDTNEPLGKDYWFLNKMKHFRNCIHVIEVKNIAPLKIEDQINLLQVYDR
jgi:sugar phosphate isomerase/epimerase